MMRLDGACKITRNVKSENTVFTLFIELCCVLWNLRWCGIATLIISVIYIASYPSAIPLFSLLHSAVPVHGDTCQCCWKMLLQTLNWSNQTLEQRVLIYCSLLLSCQDKVRSFSLSIFWICCSGWHFYHCCLMTLKSYQPLWLTWKSCKVLFPPICASARASKWPHAVWLNFHLV